MQDTTLSSVCYCKGAAWRSTSKFKHSHVTNFLTREKDKEGEETPRPELFFFLAQGLFHKLRAAQQLLEIFKRNKKSGSKHCRTQNISF